MLWIGIGLLVAVFREADEALDVCSLGEVAGDDIAVVDGSRHRHDCLWAVRYRWYAAAYALALSEDRGQLATSKLYPSGEHLLPSRGNLRFPMTVTYP